MNTLSLLQRDGLVEYDFILRLAVDYHNAAETAQSLGTHFRPEVEAATIAACLDADRVTLPRVGYAVDRDRLSTGPWLGMQLGRLVDEGRARALAEGELTWEDVLARWERVTTSGS